MFALEHAIASVVNRRRAAAAAAAADAAADVEPVSVRGVGAAHYDADNATWFATGLFAGPFTAVAPCCGLDATWTARAFKTPFGLGRIDYDIDCPCVRAEQANDRKDLDAA